MPDVVWGYKHHTCARPGIFMLLCWNPLVVIRLSGILLRCFVSIYSCGLKTQCPFCNQLNEFSSSIATQTSKLKKIHEVATCKQKCIIGASFPFNLDFLKSEKWLQGTHTYCTFSPFTRLMSKCQNGNIEEAKIDLEMLPKYLIGPETEMGWSRVVKTTGTLLARVENS